MTWLERRFGAQVTWLPFDLHPEYPPEGLPREQLIARYGPEMVGRVSAMFEARGAGPYAPHPAIVPNTRNTLRVGELAREHGLHRPYHDRAMEAYWAQSRDIGAAETIHEIAQEVGLDAGGVEEVLGSDLYQDVITTSTRQAVSNGVTGVPAFVVGGRYLLLGAQPEEAFEQAIAGLDRDDAT